MESFMINFDEYTQNLLKSTNFADVVNFDSKWAIIKETYLKNEHKLLIGEVYQALAEVYNELAELEIIDLKDYLELEKIYGR